MLLRCASIFYTIAFPINGRWDRCFNAEWAGNTDNAVIYFRTVNKDFFGGWFVIGNGFKGNVRYDTANLLAFVVLLAFIDKTANWAAGVVL